MLKMPKETLFLTTLCIKSRVTCHRIALQSICLVSEYVLLFHHIFQRMDFKFGFEMGWDYWEIAKSNPSLLPTEALYHKLRFQPKVSLAKMRIFTLI